MLLLRHITNISTVTVLHVQYSAQQYRVCVLWNCSCVRGIISSLYIILGTPRQKTILKLVHVLLITEQPVQHTLTVSHLLVQGSSQRMVDEGPEKLRGTP